MNENRDEATGQFTTAEPLVVGREANEIAHGYEPYHEPEESVSQEEATAQVEALSEAPASNLKTYGIDLPENVTLTAEQAANMLTEARKAEAEQAERDEQDRLRAEVDELRGEQPQQTKPAEIDPDKALEHPKVKEAIERVTADVETAKQHYSAAIEQADHLQSAAFRARFPDLAAHPVEQWPQLLSAMPPERAVEAANTIDQLVQVKTALQQQQFLQAEADRTRFKAASDRLEEKIKDVSKARRTEIESEIVSALQERSSNLDNAAQFLRGLQGSTEAMELLWELGDLRSQLKAIKSAPAKAIPKPVPPVQRPGIAGAARSVGESASMDSIRNQLKTAKGDQAIKLAAKLTGMQRAT
jgi:hypothetical protein